MVDSCVGIFLTKIMDARHWRCAIQTLPPFLFLVRRQPMWRWALVNALCVCALVVWRLCVRFGSVCCPPSSLLCPRPSCSGCFLFPGYGVCLCFVPVPTWLLVSVPLFPCCFVWFPCASVRCVLRCPVLSCLVLTVPPHLAGAADDDLLLRSRAIAQTNKNKKTCRNNQ